MTFSIQTVLRSGLLPGPQGPQGPGANDAFIQANAAANLVAVYANNSLVYANANINFNNTATMNVEVTANTTNKRANVEFTANLTAIGIPSINANIANANSYASNLVAVYANSSLRYANANVNFNNTSTINVLVTANTTNKAANVDLSVNSNAIIQSCTTFIQSGTNAAARTVQSKLRDFVSVTDFGADPTGTTDSTAAIQAAVDAHKSVFIPAGTYKVNSSITISSDVFEICGVKGKSILMGSGGGNIQGYFKVASPFTAENGLIERITFDSDDHTKDRWGISTANSSVYMSHCTISECNFNGRLTYGIKANLIACHVYRCTFGVFQTGSGNNLKAIESKGSLPLNLTNQNVIDQCWFARCGNPTSIVEFESGYEVIFKECIFEFLQPTQTVVYLNGVFYPTFEKCWFEDAAGSTSNGKSVIMTEADTGGNFAPVLTVNECLFHTYAANTPDGLLNFGDSPRQVAQFSKNLLVSLNCGITVGGTSNAKYVNSFGNYATIDTGGDATGLNFDDPAKFDLGISAAFINTGNANITSTLNVTTINANTVLTRSGINVSSQAANAYDQANTARNTANSAYGQANNAYDAANNRVLRTGDTVSGFLAVTKDNGTITMDSSGGYGILELGGNTGSYIDMKSPYSDDYDFRIITLQGSTTFTSNNGAQVVAFTGANVNFDSSTLFVDAINNRVGVLTNTPTVALDVNGALAKTSGSFKIDHPLTEKSNTHYLVHSFIEGPLADLVYSGKIQLENGTANVNIDSVFGMTEGTFVALCREIRCFTSNETDWDAVRGKVEGNILTIECQNQTSNAIVSWLVIGERKDKHMYETGWTHANGRVIVEPSK